ncbi:MAG TPA: WGR domain-containing protein [Candidatus Acidoferrum sp.]|nr:WGR domain-containing protein [Candidatus Acidoferrum sp.]
MQITSLQTVSLYFKLGSSDKEYHASVESLDGGYIVNFAYGRRGTTLQTGTKTSAPVDLPTATRIFTRLVAEKKAKGYTEGEAGTPYQQSEKESRVTDTLPQLLNPIAESELERLISDDHWCAQEKFDGKRILLKKEGAAIHGINRKGLLVGLPSPIVVAAHAFEGDFILDGESVGEHLHVFDLLSLNGEDLRALPFHARATALVDLLDSLRQKHLHYARTAWRADQKRQLLITLRGENKEGIVFKRIDAPYVPGRPSSGGTQLKHKFCATLSAVVGALNAKRSIEIQLLDGKRWVTAGNVTIPANHSVPAHGQVVEVRYLYAFKESGCLYQPVYLGMRTDLLAIECVTGQLKFKSDGEEHE